MAHYLPQEILDRIFVRLLNRRRLGGIVGGVKNLHSASLVCRMWRTPAQRLIQGHRRICTTIGIQKLLHISQLYPIHLRCLELELEKDWFADSPLAVTNVYVDFLLPYAKELVELNISLRRWLKDDDPLQDLIHEAPLLRSLSVVQERYDDDFKQNYDDDESRVIFAGIPTLLSDCLAPKTNLRHLHLSQLSLSAMYDIGNATPSANIQFRLSDLMLTGCIINDRDFDWLMSSQIGCLRNLALCRVAGLTKEAFQTAVGKVAPQLLRLCLNVLPFDEPGGLPAHDDQAWTLEYAEDYSGFPQKLEDGTAFPRHSLMGSSLSILPLCTRLRTLQLRDPLATSASLASLDEVIYFEVFVSPFSLEPLDMPALKARQLLPRLERLHVHWKDNRSTDLEDSFLKGCRSSAPAPFTTDSDRPVYEFSYLRWPDAIGYERNIISDDELKRMWDM